MKNILKLSIILLALTFSITSCGGGESKNTDNEMGHKDHGVNMEGKETHHHDEDMTNDHHDHSTHNHSDGMEKPRSIKATTNKNNSTTAIIDSYLKIKNALVSDNKIAAIKGGKALLLSFSKFDMSQLAGDTHKEYMEILETAKENAEHIVKSELDHQREHFEDLSQDINDLIALIGTDKKLYQDFCPMANDGKGAIWISEIKDIKNPFFGTKMPKCGKIQKEIN